MSSKMDYKELVRQIGKAGLDNAKFLRLLGRHPRSLNNSKSRGVIDPSVALNAVFMADYAERGIDYMPLVEKVLPYSEEPSA
jgi:hypothetical protein